MLAIFMDRLQRCGRSVKIGTQGVTATDFDQGVLDRLASNVQLSKSECRAEHSIDEGSCTLHRRWM